MSNSNYEINSDKVVSVDYEILIIGHPKSELEDLLTSLVSERGRIAVSRYEDFLIAHCIANLNQFMAHINSITSSGTELNMLQVRKEVVDLVLKYNKDLAPSNIVINKNKILKLRTGEEDLSEYQPLEENPFWEQTFYDENGNYTPNPKSDNQDEYVNYKKNGAGRSKNKVERGKIKNISELSYEELNVWWERFNEYIKIKKYSKDDVDSILTFRYFHNSTSFDTFVVSHCVKNIEEIYERIDGMGISVDPSKIVSELYELCKSVNPTLTFSRFKELREDDEPEEDFQQNNSAHAPQPAFGFSGRRNRKKKISFRDVPKEDLLSLDKSMKVSLVGQDEAIDKLTESVKRASVGLKDPDKPIGSFLFAGRTGCGKCVDENTIILSEKGMKPIKDFYSGDKKQVPLELMLYSAVGKEKTEYIYYEGKKIGRVVETEIGNKLGGSMIHPIVSIDTKGEIKFKRFYELEEGNFVAIKYNQNYFSKQDKELEFKFEKGYTENFNFPTSMNEDLAYFIGITTGIGNLSTPGKINFLSKDKFIVDELYMLSRDLFGVKLESDFSEGYCCNSAYVHKYLKEACKLNMFTSNLKDIPTSILESSIVSVKAFVRGLMDSSGFYNEKTNVISLTLKSKNLVRNLQLVLLNLGVVSYISNNKREKNGAFENVFNLKIYGKFVKKYFDKVGFKSSKITFRESTYTGKCVNMNEDVIPNIASKLNELCSYYTFNDKFYKKYGIYLNGLSKPNRDDVAGFLERVVKVSGPSVLSSDLYQYLKAFVDEDIFWAKITSIKDKELELYDFTVPGSNTFISNGFISHNTLATKVLANSLIRTRKNRIIIDCSEYTSDHEYSKLIGSPMGYTGFDQGGALTNAIAEDPFSVVVFDEIEKASSKVYDLLLQILDEGRLTDGKGVSVSFRDAIIIMTSNIGVSEIENVEKTIGFGDVAVLTEEKKSSSLDRALKKKFKPEFLNRIDAVVHFKDLTDEDYMKIIDLELDSLNRNLKLNNTEYKDISLTFTKKIKEFIFDKGVDVKFGARPIKRAIEKHISNKVAGLLLESDPSNIDEIKVTTLKDRVNLKIIKPKKKVVLMHAEESC